MEKLKLSPKADGVVRRLINSKDSDKVGYIAAVDPQTGETFYGKNEVEAAKEGRRAKKDTKAVFFFVRVGYPSVHVLKSINLQGYIHQLYFPVVKSCVQNRSLHIVSSINGDVQPLELIADTGFSGSLVLDTERPATADNKRIWLRYASPKFPLGELQIRSDRLYEE